MLVDGNETLVRFQRPQIVADHIMGEIVLSTQLSIDDDSMV